MPADLYDHSGITPGSGQDLYAAAGITPGTYVKAAEPNRTNFLDEAMHLGTGGLIDKLDAAAQASGILSGGVTDKTGLGFSERYREDLTNIRGNYYDYEQVNPGWVGAKGAKAVGVIAPMLVAGPEKIAQTALQASLRGAGTGALIGGAYGFGGTDDESVGQDIKATALGAAMGAGAGGALPAATSLAAAPARALTRAATAGGRENVERVAGQVLNNAAGPGGADFEPPPVAGMKPTAGQASNNPGLQWLERTLQQRGPLGQHFAGVSQAANNKAVTDMISSIGDPDVDVNEAIRNAVAATQPSGSHADQVLDLAKQHLGQDNFHETVGQLTDARRATAAPLYAAAMDSGPVVSDRINQFLADPIMKRGLSQGLQIQRLEALAEGKPFDPHDYGITDFDAAGDPVISGVPNMRLLDAAKNGLDNIVEQYRSPLTGKLNLDKMGNAVNQVRAQYVKALDDANPAYKVARAAWSGPSQSIDALNAGRNIFSGDSEMTAQRIASLSPGDLDYFRAGAMRAIEDTVTSSANGDAALNNLLARPEAQAKLRVAFGNDGRFDAFHQQAMDILNPQTDIGKVLATDRAGNYKLPTSAVADTFIRPNTGKSGAPEAFQAYLDATKDSPAAVQAARDAFAGKLRDAIQNTSLDNAGNRNVSQAKLTNFFDQYSHVIESPVFTSSQRTILGQIRDGANMAARTANGRPIGSDTYSKLSGDRFLDVLIGPGAAKLVKAVGTVVGGAIGLHSGGLMEGAVGMFTGERGSELLQKMYTAPRDRVIDLLTEAIHDPQISKALMQKASAANLSLMRPSTRAKMLGILGAEGTAPTVQRVMNGSSQ